MKNKYSAFSKNISFRILFKFIVTLILYVIAILALTFLGILFCSFVRWQENNIIYRILKPISENIGLFFILLFGGGFFVIFLYYWAKTLNYLKSIVAAAETIFNDKTTLVELPPDLRLLENQLNQIKFNVNESKRAAKEAEQRKNDLVVYLAHDLKTPLTSVIGYLTLLRDESQISTQLREKYLSISLDKAQRLEDLINEFFEITRFNLSGITLEQSKVNLSRMLEQLIFEFKPMLDEKNLQCTLTAAPDITAKCDIDKMQRVFDNLLRNAVNYSFENSTISITVTAEAESIKINFTNCGNTISQDKINRIFEQFYRLDSARTTKNGGAGIGLAIAKEIIELHKGTISASSADEIISFEITIPAL